MGNADKPYSTAIENIGKCVMHTLNIMAVGKLVCDFDLRDNGSFMIYTADEEIEGVLKDEKFLVIGRRPCEETKFNCKILEKPVRVIYQIGCCNDIEQMKIGTRHLDKRLVGIRDTGLLSSVDRDDLCMFVFDISETEQASDQIWE